MMNNKTYFVIAVIVAIVLPLIFGGIYFKDLYKKSELVASISKIKERPEILYTEANSITKLDDVAILDKDFLNSNNYSFQVVYPKSSELVTYYSLYLDNIKLSSNIGSSKFKWALMRYDSSKSEYVSIATGDLSKLDNQKILLKDSLQIRLNSVHQYKLYYWLSYSEEESSASVVGSTFEATVHIS